MTELLDRSGQGSMTGEVSSESAARTKRAFGRISRGLLVGVLAVALLGVPSVGFAGEKAAEVGRESGLGAAAALSSLVYGPVKLLYATGGLIIGSFAWIFTAGDTEVADRVFTRSLRGSYVITPEILLGEERLEFIGRDVDEEPGVARTEAVAAADVTPAATSSYDESGYDEMGW